MESKRVTVIIPIHEYNDTVEKYLERAVKSIKTNLSEVIFVGPKEVLDQASKLFPSATQVLNSNTDIYTQINKAALQCVTEYFTVLEYDDVLLPNWYTHMLKEVDGKTIVLPMNEYIEKDTFKAFGNELPWDVAFQHEEDIDEQGNTIEAGKIGYITEHELKLYSDFNVTGALIKTEDFISLGYLKPEFKVTAWYEFLMRVARANKTIYVFPRVCYSHTVLREGSYMTKVKEITTEEEVSEFLKQILNV